MNVQEKIKEYLESHRVVNVIIAGITCSGKTTLSKTIRDDFVSQYSVSIVAQDDYFKNLPDIPRTKVGYLLDSLEAFHTEEFVQDVELLLQNGVVIMPRYDITTNTRISKNKIVRAGTINILEGLHTIQLLGKVENSIKVFIDTDINTCLERRIARDTSKYGVPEKTIRQYWEACIKPMCEKFIFMQRNVADIILKE